MNQIERFASDLKAIPIPEGVISANISFGVLEVQVSRHTMLETFSEYETAPHGDSRTWKQAFVFVHGVKVFAIYKEEEKGKQLARNSNLEARN